MHDDGVTLESAPEATREGVEHIPQVQIRDYVVGQLNEQLQPVLTLQLLVRAPESVELRGVVDSRSDRGVHQWRKTNVLFGPGIGGGHQVP